MKHIWIALLTAIFPSFAWCCLWDYDTLKQERSRFPTTLELITGKFLRHSPEFYQWRINDRRMRLKSDPNNPDLLDDLAVAYEKTGQHDQAIATMLEKEKAHPGRYETYSNLGTFYILAGEFEKGLPWIDKALTINPNAHFGRERYQRWLVEYALTKRSDTGELQFPLQRFEKSRSPGNFRDFLEKKLGKEELSLEDSQQAIQGVLGMMRFANHDNPLLLEALGDLLLPAYDREMDAKQLSARAYLKASIDADSESVKAGYRELAEAALGLQTGNRLATVGDQMPIEELEEDFSEELVQANQWYAKLKNQELSWIHENRDVDAEFDKLYTSEPSVTARERARRPPSIYFPIIASGMFLVGAGSIIFAFATKRRRKALGSNEPAS